MRAWYDQGSSKTVRRTKELFSSSQVFTQVSNKRKYDKLIIKDSKRSYLSRTTNSLTQNLLTQSLLLQSWFHHHDWEDAGAGPNWVWNPPDFENYTLMVRLSSMLSSTTTTPAIPASIRNGLQRSHLGRENTPQTTTASFVPLVCQLFHVLF